MFWLVPRPPGHPAPQNGSPRMFRVDWIEKYLSRVKPWQVLVVWVPVIAYLVYRGLQVPGVSRGAFAGALLGGLAFWTLLEYVLHRWVFHFTPKPELGALPRTFTSSSTASTTTGPTMPTGS